MLDRFLLEKIIFDEEKSRRVVRCIDISEEPLEQKNENYTSVITRIKITVETGSGASSVISFIAKKMPDSDHMLKFYNEFACNDKEVVAYESLGQMDKLMKSREDHRENLWCELKCSTTRALLFEDLTAIGYKPYSEGSLLDEEHSKFVMRELARYHALSIALFEKNLLDPKKFKPLHIFYESTQDKFHKAALISLRDGVTTWGQEWRENVNQLTQIIDNFGQVTRRLERINRTTLNVMCHGDCWIGNFLFKHDLGRIISMKFVDFQLVGHCSYIYDVVKFLYSSIEPELRLRQLDELLMSYHESLLEEMKFYCTESKPPTMKEIKDSVEYLQAINIIMLSMYWPVTSNETGINVTDAYEDKAIYKPEMYSSEKSRRILGRELRAMQGKDILSE